MWRGAEEGFLAVVGVTPLAAVVGSPDIVLATVRDREAAPVMTAGSGQPGRPVQAYVGSPLAAASAVVCAACVVPAA